MNQRKWIILINLVIVLAFFNYQIVQKEQILEEAKLVLLKLAPVDPRSLMQGDYMRLNYALNRQMNLDTLLRTNTSGFVVIRIDKNKVGKALRLQTDLTPLASDEWPIRFRYTGRRIRIGAESYFFEEGQAEKFVEARYGGMRISADGEAVLVGLYDENYKLIQP